jgi:hypothetical protein
VKNFNPGCHEKENGNTMVAGGARKAGKRKMGAGTDHEDDVECDELFRFP